MPQTQPRMPQAMNSTPSTKLLPIAAKHHDGPYRIVVLLSGRGSNFKALAEALDKNHGPSSESPAEIVLVVSDKSDAAGLEIAASRNIPTAVVKREPKKRTNEQFNTALAERVAEVKPDLVVLAGFMRVLTAEFIAAFPERIINIHPSLLPAFRGLNAAAQALESGVKVAGCSVHLVVVEVDAGRILAQAAVPVLPDDDEQRLAARILNEEHRVLPEVVSLLIRGKLGTVQVGNRTVVATLGEPAT